MFPLFIHLRILDILDIILVALLFSQLYRLIRGTIAINIFAGIFSVYLFWLLVKALDMELLSSILGQFIGVGVIALIIVFQQEIRRFLLILGGRYTTRGWNLFNKFFSNEEKTWQESKIDDIVNACKNMSKDNTGALIIIARKSELNTIIETGDILNADISSRFLESIFFGNNPLHDGAAIIMDERVRAARCVLPTTENIYLPAKYGMRHRAAVGMTERTDAIAVVVSEESGEISLSVDGELLSGLKPEELKARLTNELN
jgi:uncharacterized protein (TIGR00159 family)